MWMWPIRWQSHKTNASVGIAPKDVFLHCFSPFRIHEFPTENELGPEEPGTMSTPFERPPRLVKVKARNSFVIV